ncbi:phosphatase PAP2 family protein [Sphingobacterium thalpophilum]|uniref:phosphatase PAP2 family protein n=1 Tax=Sphingobacterium thalpophilum TaxID=259 RepID=UPI0031D5191C
MNNIVNTNFGEVKLSLFYVPFILLVILAMFLSVHNIWTVNSYISVQKEAFLRLNLVLSRYPSLMENLTQLGDALVILSFLSCLLIVTPRICEPLVLGSLISGLLCCSLKWLFRVPRPAAVLDTDQFVIIGKKLVGSNSLPSGHAVTVLTILTVILIAFMPLRELKKLVWILVFIIISTGISMTRVGVGAHYVLDVMIGGIIGYISAVAGIIASQKLDLWRFISKEYYYAFWIVLFLVCCVILFLEIVEQQLPVLYLSFISLCFSLYMAIRMYKEKQVKT